MAPYIHAILDSQSTELPRLECPVLNETRFGQLQTRSRGNETTASIEYFFALDLRECLPILPRLIGSVLEVIRFLGPDRCALSIVQGNDNDGTGDVLEHLQPFLKQEKIPYYYQWSDIDPAAGSRIESLAELRNLALQPLLDDSKSTESATIIFLNDVAPCPDDILELVLQRRLLDATMTCAMDWTYVGRDPTFYDVWISRGMTGDSFFNIPADGSWDQAWNLFWNDPQAQSRLRSNLPFQVFACWNGATAFSAKPILDGLRFRAANEEKGECPQGEPELFCKDLWFRGYGKIAVVPSVNLEYSDDAGLRIKKLKGYTSDLVRGNDPEQERIEWVEEPPEKVKCMPGWDKQVWRPWNATLSEDDS